MSYERMFGCDVSVIDEAIEDWLSKPRRGDTKNMAYSMLSDVQELLSMGASSETIRMKINKVKYVLDFDETSKEKKEVKLDEILQDKMVRKELSDLVLGLHSEADKKGFPVEFEDWECRLANRMYVLVGGASNE